MKFKIVSLNNELKRKATHIFTILNMKESIHIQDVDFWLIDVETIDEKAIESYKNRQASVFLLFVVNDDEDIKVLLGNGFSNYVKLPFSDEELKSWYKFFIDSKKSEIININDNLILNIEKNILTFNKKTYILTKQEMALLKSLISGDFVSTKLLKLILNLNSETSVRTIINRIRKKVCTEIFIQKRNYGYKLNISSSKSEISISDSYVKELEEQNALIQKIVDCSSIFIVTFIHKQLFCINKSFRELLGKDILKDLWDEESGDFFKLINHSSKDKNKIKEDLFNIKSISNIEIFDSSLNDYKKYKVQTYFFEKIDKHLLVFTKL